MATKAPFFVGLNQVRDLISTTESPEIALEQASDLLHDDAIRREFFNVLDDPAWLQALRTRGFFAVPPEPERVAGGGLRCAIWPQSRYLTRIAARAPAQVAETLRTIRTNNWLVASDIIAAAAAMPAEHIATLVPLIGDLARRFRLWHLLDDIGELVARLANESQDAAALDLVRLAFAIEREDDPAQVQHGSDLSYFEGLRDFVVPALAPTRGRDLVDLMLQWLRVTIDTKKERPTGSDDDYSYVWRPAIEEHEQNRDYSFGAKLVGCVRDGCELAIRGGGASLEGVLQLLNPSGLLIERRLRIHLIGEFADADRELACRTMLDRTLFEDYGCKHEYARLVGRRFPLLSADQQAEWLGWIDEGTDQGEAVDAENPQIVAKRRQHWQFQHLHWIKDHLAGNRREFYDRMHKEYGEPHLADLVVYSGTARWGQESPHSAKQLAEMGFERAVETVATWRPGPGDSRLNGPTREGLNQAFREYLSTDPVGFSSQATLMTAKPAFYVRSFLHAMEAAVKEGKDIDLSAVLDLSAWVVDQPLDQDTSLAAEHERLVDRDWQWCRDLVAEFARAVCQGKDAAKRPRYPLDLRDRIWPVIALLPDVPAKSYVVREDVERDPRVANWPLLSLNSPRGKAMHAVFAYADWVADHRVANRGEHRAFPGGFGQMPEVRALLQAQIERLDRDFTEVAVFGWHTGLLYWLDANWLRAHIAQVFNLRASEDAPSQAFGWAAWNTFLFSHTPHIEFYRILQDQFSYAVDQAVALDPPRSASEQPFGRLGEHLITLYGRGNLGDAAEDAWNADDAIIRRLVTTTHVSVRSHAVRFVGQILQGAHGDVPEPVLQRFRYLWEQYWLAVGETDATTDPTSSVFGYWFSSGAFDEDWSLRQLEAFVSAARKAEPDHMLVERLAAIVDVDPARCSRIVGKLVDGDDEGWRVSSWKDEAKRVLQSALVAGGEGADEATRVIDRLGRRGFLDFGQLLPESSTRNP